MSAEEERRRVLKWEERLAMIALWQLMREESRI